MWVRTVWRDMMNGWIGEFGVAFNGACITLFKSYTFIRNGKLLMVLMYGVWFYEAEGKVALVT